MALPQNPPKFARVGTGSKEISLEINDANFETKAWKSSRYDGHQLIAAKGINISTKDDVGNNSKSPIIQHYSRNIYVGNAIVGMDENGSEDPTLVKIPSFSYITTNRYLTVNDDESISDNKIDITKTNVDSKLGFYRSFYEDFPIGNDCRIVVNDESIKTNLKDRYNIYFNGGQFEKLIGITFPSTGFNISSNSELFSIQQNLTTKFSALVKFFNKNELRNFYTGSLDTLDGDTINLKIPQLSSFITPFFTNYKDTSNYVGDKRMFLSFCTQSGTPTTPSTGDEFEPIRTVIDTGTPTTGGGGLNLANVGITTPTQNLAEISTTEVIDIRLIGNGAPGTTLSFDTTYLFPTNQIYHPGTSFNNGGSGGIETFETNATPSAFNRGSILLNKCDDAVPSLLVNLPKNEHLPDGIGQKSFVIIPENLHPHIKRNLIYFLARAGISLGIDAIPALDTTFKQLK